MNLEVLNDINNLQPINTDVLLIPILQDHNKHRKENNLSFVYVYDISNKKEYILNVLHHDYPQSLNGTKIKEKLLGKIYIFNKSYLFNTFPDSLDINLFHWITTNEPMEVQYTKEISVYHNWYRDINNCNNIIPMMNWLTYCRNIKAQCISIINNTTESPEYDFYNEMLLNNLYRIENSGLATNPNLTKKYINKEKIDRLYCQYNMFTSTGRPSNHFNSINFAALNKRTGIRSMIIPRTDNGYLIEFDYDSMHVRLTADLIKHDLPGGNLHEYFGRYYFKTPVLEEEMYEKSKSLTWHLLYGNISNHYQEIPFFKSVLEYRKQLWSKFKKDGFVEMPISGRKIMRSNFGDNMTQNVLFNYLLQGHETEYNSLMLHDIFKYLYKRDSKLILYTYDSFLFDYNVNDGPTFVKDIENILNQKNMKTTIKYGKNYHQMKKLQQ